MIDLLSEFRRSLGVTVEWSPDEACLPVGRVRVERIGRGLYQPAEAAGEPCLLVPVTEDGALVDLVAFPRSAPSDWLLRTGNGWALGLADSIGSHMWAEKVRLFDSPVDWVRGKRAGICVVDWESPEVRSLDVLPRVICSPRIGSLLRRALTRPPRLPQISLMEARHAA